MAQFGVDSRTLRAFRVGYAPGNTRELLDRLAVAGHTPAELIAAGIASHSERSHLHVRFHARIMFPISDIDGRTLGFAGLATHLGPSWPLWLTSPVRGAFDPGAAIFGIGQAAPAITTARRVLVVRDCVQVLALHQQGRRDSVAVMGSPITRRHLAQFAAALGVSDVHLARHGVRTGVLVVPDDADVTEDAFALPAIPAGFSLIDTPRGPGRGVPAERSAIAEPDYDPAPARTVVYLTGTLVGVGIPIGLLLIAGPHNEPAKGSAPTLNLVIAGVAAAYLLLMLIVSRISARVRERSRARRMREPWARGSGEWQPSGWTYHRLEEILVGAALASAITCVVLLMTIGGFLG
jgi:hypothetical protein